MKKYIIAYVLIILFSGWWIRYHQVNQDLPKQIVYEEFSTPKKLRLRDLEIEIKKIELRPIRRDQYGAIRPLRVQFRMKSFAKKSVNMVAVANEFQFINWSMGTRTLQLEQQAQEEDQYILKPGKEREISFEYEAPVLERNDQRYRFVITPSLYKKEFNHQWQKGVLYYQGFSVQEGKQ